MTDKITVIDLDAHNFRVGMAVECSMDDVVAMYRARGSIGRAFVRLRRRLRRWTRWWRVQTVTTMVDLNTGTITLGQERWSWRRWRWERLP